MQRSFGSVLNSDVSTSEQDGGICKKSLPLKVRVYTFALQMKTSPHNQLAQAILARAILTQVILFSYFVQLVHRVQLGARHGFATCGESCGRRGQLC